MPSYKPLLYLPPYFGAVTDGNLIKCYTPGKELSGVFNSWENYYNYIRLETLKKEEAHRLLVEERWREEEERRRSGFTLELKL